MKYLILLLSGMLALSAAHAGCGEGRGQCYYYKAGALKSKGSCKVTTCAATDQYFYSTWEWEKGNNKVNIGLGDENKPAEARSLLLNGKPAYFLDLPLKNERMICYGIVNSDELMCNDSGNF